MKEIVVYLVVSSLLIASAHVWSAVKSGCFYASQKKDAKNPLKKYIDNLHRAQTPFWYSLFGSLFFMTLAVARLIQDTDIVCALVDLSYFKALFYSYLITHGTSAFAGVFYQGYINIGSGKPFIDVKEKRKFELAFESYSVWLPKFWYGKNRIWISAIGIVMIALGIFLILQ